MEFWGYRGGLGQRSIEFDWYPDWYSALIRLTSSLRINVQASPPSMKGGSLNVDSQTSSHHFEYQILWGIQESITRSDTQNGLTRAMHIIAVLWLNSCIILKFINNYCHTLRQIYSFITMIREIHGEIHNMTYVQNKCEKMRDLEKIHTSTPSSRCYNSSSFSSYTPLPCEGSRV